MAGGHRERGRPRKDTSGAPHVKGVAEESAAPTQTHKLNCNSADEALHLTSK